MTNHRWILSLLAIAFATTGCLDNTSTDADGTEVVHRTVIELRPGLDLSRVTLGFDNGYEISAQSVADHVDLDGQSELVIEPEGATPDAIRGQCWRDGYVTICCVSDDAGSTFCGLSV